MATPLTSDAEIVVAGTASDSHTWNLVFLQLFLEELGHRVRNLGPCVPEELLVDTCRFARPSLVVLSTVNGHGAYDGVRAVRAIRRCPELTRVPVVIGGLLGITGHDNGVHTHLLIAGGFDAVFDGSTGLPSFRDYVSELLVGAGR